MFITEKWIEVCDQSGTAEDRFNPNKQIRFKSPMLRSDLCDYNDLCIVVKGVINVINPANDIYDKKLPLHHLLAAFQELIIHLLIMQKI